MSVPAAVSTNAPDIRLPLPPRSEPRVGPDGTRPEEAVVTLLNGKKLVGHLYRFVPDENAIVVHEHDGAETTRLPVSEIKMIHVAESREYVLSRDYLQGEGSDAVMPPERQEFHVECADGQHIDGETFGYTTDTNGLHLFLAQPFYQYNHRFFPFTALRDYRIGPYLGQMLVSEQAVTEEHLDSALQQQQEAREQRLGDYLTAQEILSTDQLNKALERQKATPNLKLGEVLIQEGVISKEQLDQALEEQQKNRKRPLGEVLMDMGLVTQDTVSKTLATKLGIPFVNLRKFTFDPNAIKAVPEYLARKHHMVPLSLQESRLVVAVADPLNNTPLEDVRFHTRLFVEPVMADSKDIEWAVNRYYGTQLDDLAASLGEEVEEPQHESTEVGEADNTLVKLVNKIIMSAYEQGASDIHIEPGQGRQKVNIRFRVDGSLVPYLELPHNYRSALISRLKIMCDLDITERRKPQDGKINFKRFGPANIELRVATVPTAGGVEDVVLRLLASGDPIPLDQMGLQSENLADIQNLASKPYGLFLVCGPTGSGKTTTLHSVLKYINTPDKKIWTAEDPVEISQKGLRQVQVNNKIDLTFANAMRSFLRADPDVIMVGEMRDEETSAIGIEASLTGHLVFSTLHTNSAPESVVRLLDMGMDPFNFSDALLGVLAQRLAKRLCASCRRPYQADEEALTELAREYCYELSTSQEGAGECADIRTLVNGWRERYGTDGVITLYEAHGCEECSYTGYRGRIGIHELLVATHAIKRLIHERATVADIFAAASKEGMRTLKQDGILKVLRGHTDLAQIRAVCIR